MYGYIINPNDKSFLYLLILINVSPLANLYTHPVQMFSIVSHTES